MNTLDDDIRNKIVEIHTIVTQNHMPVIKDHEVRIRGLEKGRFKEMGAIGAMGSVIGYLATHFFK